MFRPSETKSSQAKRIAFLHPPAANQVATSEDLAGVVDAFTGEALNPTLGLYQCRKCQVYYHRASYEVIKSENGGQCVACLNVSIRAISRPHARQGGAASTAERRTERTKAPAFEPDTVTLLNYRERVGRVVSFTGPVRKVVKSRSGKDYAIMFEDADWCDGFKMVIFRGKITAFGGGAFLKSLAGRTIFARGLLQKHRTFGYQIVVSEPSMFWTVR
jgi:hypothetical protein